MQFNNNGQAIYLQIADYVCEKVLLQDYKPEDRMPSVRELGMQLEVNPNTVIRAYEFLKQLQIIGDKRGIGYFIMPAAKDNALQYLKEEFAEKEMPVLYRKMIILGMTPADLEPTFKKFKKKYVTA